jgi:GT2 family glycosyltransferase
MLRPSNQAPATTDVNGARSAIVVVDDGSDLEQRHSLHRLLDDLSPEITIVDQPINRGPAAARNVGASSVAAEVIVFVDSGVAIQAEGLQKLVAWLTDSSISASAPRVGTTPDKGFIARYEERASPLDVAGNDLQLPLLVGPGRLITYVPSTVFAIRAEEFRAAGGFDESMRFGEDVDLIWRLHRSHHQVVLDPTVHADHPARSSVARFAHQRYSYGTSAGPLGHRHGDLVAPAVLRPALAVAAAALFLSRRRDATVFAVASLARDAYLRSRLFSEATGGLPGSAALGASESLRFNISGGLRLVSVLNRTWWPPTAALIAQPWSGRLRRRAFAVVAAGLIGRVRTVGIRAIPLAVVEDLAYGAGVWRSTLEERTIAALMPRLLRGR